MITGPIDQVGCCSACSSVTRGELLAGPAAERSAAGGQHQAAYLRGGAAPQALGDRGVLRVDRHDLAGLRARGDQRAAHDQGLLVGQRQGVAGVERGQGRAQPDGAGDAVEHHVAGHPRGLGGRLLAEPGGRRAELGDLAARRARRWSRPRSARRRGSGRGCARTRSRAWVPMEPVEPRTTMSRLTMRSRRRWSGPREARSTSGVRIGSTTSPASTAARWAAVPPRHPPRRGAGGRPAPRHSRRGRCGRPAAPWPTELGGVVDRDHGQLRRARRRRLSRARPARAVRRRRVPGDGTQSGAGQLGDHVLPRGQPADQRPRPPVRRRRRAARPRRRPPR